MEKKLQLKKISIFATAFVFIVAMIFLIFKYSSSSENKINQSQNMDSNTEFKQIENQVTSDELKAQVVNSDITVNSEIDISSLSEIPLLNSTVSDLTSKGMPLMPYGRQKAYEQTKGQAISEVIADLGNPFILNYTRNHNFTGTPYMISTWANDITSNLKVLRLIEEGRNNSNEIASLLEKAISDNLKYFEETYKLWRDLHSSEETPLIESVSIADEYYNQHNRYNNPVYEMERILHVIYSSFYILDNIGQLNNLELLSKWIDISSKCMYSCGEMNIWLIDQYFKNNNSSFAETHEKLKGEQYISGKSIKVSKWNALWSVNDPMINAMNVNTSDIQTIEILEIPYNLSIEDKNIFAIHNNFQSYHKEVE